MVSLGFKSCLVLLWFLIATHSMRCPFVEARQGWDSSKDDDFTLPPTDVEVLPVQKEVAESHQLAPASRRSTAGIGARKMMAATSDQVVLNGATLVSTSVAAPSLGTDAEKHIHLPKNKDQKENKNVWVPKPPSTPATAKTLRISRKTITQIQEVHPPSTQMDTSSMTAIDGEKEEEPKKEEKKKQLLESEYDDEIVNLMHKDYRGPPKAKRKPPINNHEPSH